MPAPDGSRPIGPPITTAFQPILDTATGAVFASEALVRGPDEEEAGWVFARVDRADRHRFDTLCRMRAIEAAAKARLARTGALLSLNILPAAATEHRLPPLLEAAAKAGFAPSQLMLEVTEDAEPADPVALCQFGAACRAAGVLTAMDDFGSGSSGLGRLSAFRPDLVKLDRSLVQDVAGDLAQQAILHCVAGLCGALGMRAVAEGVETAADYHALRGLGIGLVQGWLVGRPVVGRLAPARVP